MNKEQKKRKNQCYMRNLKRRATQNDPKAIEILRKRGYHCENNLKKRIENGDPAAEQMLENYLKQRQPFEIDQEPGEKNAE